MGFAAAAPFVFKSLSCPLSGITADLLRRNHLSTKTVRRVYYATGNGGLLMYMPYAKGLKKNYLCEVLLRHVKACFEA